MAEQTNPVQTDDAATAPPANGAETLLGPAGPLAPDLDLPRELADHPRYCVVRQLGSGGMGAVYEAIHRVMERPVALKVMRPDLIANLAAVERFRREVKAAAQLVHPNIVTAFDAEQIGNLHFLVMEYVEGRDLAAVVSVSGPLPVARAASYIRQAARGLQHAFEKGMTHRDVKPHNLMLADAGTALDLEVRANGQVKILDFGLARFASDEAGGPQTASGIIMGTVDYMAPEQADSARKADIRSDIYSLGCTLFYLLTGRAVFPDGTIIQRVMAHVEKTPPALNTLRPGITAGLERVLAKMLAKEPTQRYQTPKEVIEALAPFVDPLANAVPVVELLDALPADAAPATPIIARPRSRPPAPVPVPVPAPRRSGRVLLGCFLLAMTLILGGLGGAVYLVREAMDRAGSFLDNQMAEMKRQGEVWDELNRTFVPPSEAASPAELFPARFGEFELISADLQADYPPLDLVVKGRHAEYKSGQRRLNVCVYRATALEREAIYRRALDKLKPKATPGQVKTIPAPIGISSVEGSEKDVALKYRHNFGQGQERGALWWNREWLVFLRIDANDDPTTLLQQFITERSSKSWAQ